MARLTKEQEMYLAGMQAALKIAKSQGVKELEKEVTYRCNYEIPVGINRKELTQLARIKSKEELMYLVTAMTDTLTNYMHMPPTVIKEYLRQFNKQIQAFRDDKEYYEQVQLSLDYDTAMVEALKEFIQEDDNDESN